MSQTNDLLSPAGKFHPGSYLQADQPCHVMEINGNDPLFYLSPQASFPRETHRFYWDVTTIWMPDYIRYTTYDSHGNVLILLKTDASTGDTLERTTYTWDTEQRITKIIQQLWTNGNWENNEQIYFEYDDHGNQTIFLFYTWQGGWEPMQGTKHIYTYDNNNMVEEITQYWNQVQTTWDNVNKFIYTYDINGYRTEQVYQTWDGNLNVWSSMTKESYMLDALGIPYEMIVQSWDDANSAWVNYMKHTNIVWHEWSGEFYDSDLQSVTNLQWNNGIWENYSRIECDWDANGSCIETQQQYFNGNWTNSMRHTENYDDHGQFILYTSEYWMNNTWVIDMGSQNLLTYDGNDLIRRIAQEYDHITHVWINSFKEEYSDFIYIQGIGDNPMARFSIQLYPNPSTGMLYLQPELTETAIISIEVMNTGGQVVYSENITNSGETVHPVDLSGCAKGLYVVKLTVGGKTGMGKVVVR